MHLFTSMVTDPEVSVENSGFSLNLYRGQVEYEIEKQKNCNGSVIVLELSVSNSIMFPSTSFVNPTPLAHADTQRDNHPSGGLSQPFLENG
ncbi:UNVERIFIED_CONTAM: hypothetical protein NCL1_49361 [Trichonephila clavipes]